MVLIAYQYLLSIVPQQKKILANDVYEPDTINFVISNCAKGDVVHAGAYFGDFLPAFSKALTLESQVWAFEPIQENYFCTRKTLEINRVSNVVLTNAGLGATEENLQMLTVEAGGFSWWG